MLGQIVQLIGHVQQISGAEWSVPPLTEVTNDHIEVFIENVQEGLKALRVVADVGGECLQLVVLG